MQANSRGVTLIELVVVVMIVGILAAIAIPSYQNYVLRSHRVEAKSALMAIAAAQEKFYLACNTYTENLTDSVTETDCTKRGLGFGDSDTGTDGLQTENGWYTISFDDSVTVDASGFMLRADAIGTQSRDADCGFFTLDSEGARAAENGDCWN